MTQPGLRALLAAGLMVLALASSFPAIAIGLRGFDPLPMAALRLTLAALAGIAILALGAGLRPTRREWLLIAAGGLLSGLGFVLGNTGQLTVSIGAASFLLGMQPLYIALFGVLLFGELFTGRNWLGLALAVAGLVLVSLGQPGGLRLGAGVVLLIGAAVSGAAAALVQRPLVAAFNPLRTSALIFLAAAVWLSPWLLEGLAQAARAETGPLLAVLYLAVVPTFAGQLGLAYSIRYLGVARAGMLFYLIPVAAMAIAWAGLGQRPEAVTLLGGAALVAGVALATRRRPAAPPAAEPAPARPASPAAPASHH